ncbi:MAG TPA: hypothetical protein DDY32_05205 [Desulfobulbaceae bacterium]|nr:hypothetical protein [Desulfobulbaceae bacterium]
MLYIIFLLSFCFCFYFPLLMQLLIMLLLLFCVYHFFSFMQLSISAFNVEFCGTRVFCGFRRNDLLHNIYNNLTKIPVY